MASVQGPIIIDSDESTFSDSEFESPALLINTRQTMASVQEPIIIDSDPESTCSDSEFESPALLIAPVQELIVISSDDESTYSDSEFGSPLPSGVGARHTTSRETIAGNKPGAGCELESNAERPPTAEGVYPSRSPSSSQTPPRRSSTHIESSVGTLSSLASLSSKAAAGDGIGLANVDQQIASTMAVTPHRYPASLAFPPSHSPLPTPPFPAARSITRASDAGLCPGEPGCSLQRAEGSYRQGQGLGCTGLSPLSVMPKRSREESGHSGSPIKARSKNNPSSTVHVVDSAYEGDSESDTGEPANSKSPVQPSRSQDQASCLRLLRDVDDDRQNSCGENGNDDFAQSLRRKRRRISTPTPIVHQPVTTTRLYPPLRRVHRPSRAPTRQRQRSVHSPPASQWGSALEPIARFEEWSLENAVLKRTIVNSVATFQLEFSWDACANHGQVALAPEKPRRRPLGKTLSRKEIKAYGMPEKGPALPAETSEAGNTSNLVSGDDDNRVYRINCLLERWRKSEFLVKWLDGSYSWEPRAHLSKEDVKDFEAVYKGFSLKVEEVRETWTRRRKTKYLVGWTGFPKSTDRWVEKKDLSPELVQRYKPNTRKTKRRRGY